MVGVRSVARDCTRPEPQPRSCASPAEPCSNAPLFTKPCELLLVLVAIDHHVSPTNQKRIVPASSQRRLNTFFVKLCSQLGIAQCACLVLDDVLALREDVMFYGGPH